MSSTKLSSFISVCAGWLTPCNSWVIRQFRREVLRRHVAARFTDYLHAFIINSAYGGIYPKDK